jgi:hypothetical protein
MKQMTLFTTIIAHTSIFVHKNLFNIKKYVYIVFPPFSKGGAKNLILYLKIHLFQKVEPKI